MSHSSSIEIEESDDLLKKDDLIYLVFIMEYLMEHQHPSLFVIFVLLMRMIVH